MIKNRKITIAFLVASGVIIVISDLIKNIDIDIPTLLGATLGLFLFPLIISYLIKGINKLFKKELQGDSFVATYSIIWLFFVVSNLIVTAHETNSKNESDKTSSEFLYFPKDSKFSIVFSSKPIITAAAVPSGSDFIKGEIAEVILSNETSFQRVEFYLLNENILNSMDKDYTLKFLNEYSRNNGFKNPEIKYEEKKEKKYAELRAYKELTDNKENKRMITFVIKLYVSKSSFFVTHVASESKDFPTSEIIRFWNSLKQVNPSDSSSAENL